MSSHFEQIWTPVSQLPHIKFPPNQDLVLGTLLHDPKDPRRALSKKPLVSIKKVEVLEDETPEPWDWDSKEHQTIAGKLWASISAGIPGLGLGLGGSGSLSSSGNVRFHADSVKADWFSPDHAYLQDLVKKPLVSSYCKKWNKPPVYLVVGLLIATNGTFQISKGKERVYKTNVDAKAAEAGGGGVETEYSRGKDTNLSTSASTPFVLAYQLVRIKVNKDDSYKEKNFNGFALFDDSNEDKESWEMTPCTPEDILV